MLPENQVVEIMVSWLRSQGCVVEGERYGTQKGHDIEAKDGQGIPFYIECKGSCSPRTQREFLTPYKWRLASGALFNQLKLRSNDKNARIGIALPDEPGYLDLMAGLEDVVREFRLEVYWVKDERSIRCLPGSELK